MQITITLIKKTQNSKSFVADVMAAASAKFRSLKGKGETSGAINQTASAHAAMSKLYENRKMIGTVIYSVKCTHKNVSLFAPLILDPDKLVFSLEPVIPKKTISIPLIPQNYAPKLKKKKTKHILIFR